VAEELIDGHKLATAHLLATFFELAKLALRRHVDGEAANTVEVDAERLADEL